MRLLTNVICWNYIIKLNVSTFWPSTLPNEPVFSKWPMIVWNYVSLYCFLPFPVFLPWSSTSVSSHQLPNKLPTLITWSQDLLLEGSKSKQSLSRVRLVIEEIVPEGRVGNQGMPRKTQSRFVTGQRAWCFFKQYNIWDRKQLAVYHFGTPLPWTGLSGH